jgi:hypothetical protein
MLVRQRCRPVLKKCGDAIREPGIRVYVSCGENDRSSGETASALGARVDGSTPTPLQRSKKFSDVLWLAFSLHGEVSRACLRETRAGCFTSLMRWPYHAEVVILTEMGKSDANLGTVATHLGFPSHYRTEKSLGPMCYCGSLHN